MPKCNYYFGKGEYKDVLTCLSTTKVNSYKTSSLPLAQFWEPKKELDNILSRLREETSVDISEGNRYFEYPTPCEDESGKKLLHSFPSMTDLMIINDQYQVAIEGKYTEYSESKYETIKEWNKNNEEHKVAIKTQWFKYLTDCGASNKTELDDNIPYQFLHRTASACYNCSENGRKPVLIYQLFYDDDNQEKKNDFINDLKEWANKLGFTDQIIFLVIEVKIININEVAEKYAGVRSDLFLIMKEMKDPIYKFDWKEINISKI